MKHSDKNLFIWSSYQNFIYYLIHTKIFKYIHSKLESVANYPILAYIEMKICKTWYHQNADFTEPRKKDSLSS